MKRAHEDVRDPIPLLNSIVKRWPKPKPGVNDIAAAHRLLQADLADGFDQLDFYNPVASVAEVESVEIAPGRATVFFHDENETLQRAVFGSYESEKWKLESLKFQCPVCFGSGVNDDSTCTICGGSGWGVS